MRRSGRPRPTLRALALTGAAALVLSACGGDDPTIDVSGAPDDEVEEPVDEPEPEPEPEPEDEPEVDDEPEAEPEPDVAAGATPDADLVADPCGPHQGREGEAFVAVAAPVDDQDLGDGVDVSLVGCSNVFEANVVWELYVDDEVVADGFTTAECGNGCVGAFEEDVDLSAGAGSGAAELHVFSPDASDGEGDGDDRREVIDVTFG